MIIREGVKKQCIYFGVTVNFRVRQEKEGFFLIDHHLPVH